MTTRKKIDANKQNAQLSTGPLTDQGKAIVSRNAFKHGIFTKDLIISCGDGKEDEKEYEELLKGLIVSLIPQGQMEHLLVEKIAVDFWRLKRVLRFESGSIRKYLDMTISDYYNKADFFAGNVIPKANDQLDEEIAGQKGFINWNKRYIKALEKGVVRFDKPTWEGEGLICDIEANIRTLCDDIVEKESNEQQKKQFKEARFSFDQIMEILKNAGHTDISIARDIIECLEKQNRDYQMRIHELQQEKLKNRYAEEVNVKINSLPKEDSVEKIIKYEKAIQKSIFQNLAILKRLQSLP